MVRNSSDHLPAEGFTDCSLVVKDITEELAAVQDLEIAGYMDTTWQF